MTNQLKPGQFIEVNYAELCAIHKKTLDDHERLRDAAPDLLKALEEIVEFWDSIVPTDCINEMHVKARAAISKAKGSMT